MSGTIFSPSFRFVFESHFFIVCLYRVFTWQTGSVIKPFGRQVLPVSPRLSSVAHRPRGYVGSPVRPVQPSPVRSCRVEFSPVQSSSVHTDIPYFPPHSTAQHSTTKSDNIRTHTHARAHTCAQCGHSTKSRPPTPNRHSYNPPHCSPLSHRPTSAPPHCHTRHRPEASPHCHRLHSHSNPHRDQQSDPFGRPSARASASQRGAADVGAVSCRRGGGRTGGRLGHLLFPSARPPWSWHWRHRCCFPRQYLCCCYRCCYDGLWRW